MEAQLHEESNAFSSLLMKLKAHHNAKPLSAGLTFPILKVRSPSFLSIF